MPIARIGYQLLRGVRPPAYTTRMPRVFLIDTDTASDDAVALIMALRTPGVHVAAITIVAGNVPLDQATRNALYTAELCNSDVPIFPGATRPLIRPYQHAQWFHGNDGLGDQGYPPPRSRPEPRPAVDAIVETVTANPGLTQPADRLIGVIRRIVVV